MRRFLVIFMAFALLLTFCGCSKSEKVISCGDVIAAYEEAGYEVWHSEWENQDFTYSVQANDPKTGEYISFHFFETSEEAEVYAETRQYHVLIWIFSVIYGDPSWLTTKTYQNIEIEYDHSYLYEPFQKLIRE